MNKTLIGKKIKIAFIDNKPLFVFLLLWFMGGWLAHIYIVKLPFADAFRASLFLKQIDHDFCFGYAMWSQGIIFGIIFAVLLQNIIGKYNPERGCRMIAREMEGHIIVVGYSHLGQRLVHHFIEKNIPYCLIEKDKERIDELLRNGAPVVVDDAREHDALIDAAIGKAKAVIIASNNMETALIVTKRARDGNKDCRIITRCFDDEFTEVIEKLGANEVISSSKNAFDDLAKLLHI
jgi:hypothetical protein